MIQLLMILSLMGVRVNLTQTALADSHPCSWPNPCAKAAPVVAVVDSHPCNWPNPCSRTA